MSARPVQSMYRFVWPDEPEKTIVEGWYVNANGFASAMVAVVHPGFDWSAYIGGHNDHSEKDTLLFVARQGVKAPEYLARFVFPEDELCEALECELPMGWRP